MSKHITMKMWEEARSWENVGVPGDTVDEEIVEQFLNCVPPASNRAGYMQCGEPYSHEPVEGKKWYAPTYTTFAKTGEDGKWVYCGECFRGETEDRRKDRRVLDT